MGARSERRTRSASAGRLRDFALANEQHRELIAANAGERILRAQMALKPPGHRQQQAVATHQAEARNSRS